jgi:hypothetical protein
MRYIYRTPKLKIIYTYLMGGQTDWFGQTYPGWWMVPGDYARTNLTVNGKFDISLIKQKIVTTLASQEESEPFYYYNAAYRFKIPCEKNLNILAARIKKELEKNFNV